MFAARQWLGKASDQFGPFGTFDPPPLVPFVDQTITNYTQVVRDATEILSSY